MRRALLFVALPLGLAGCGGGGGGSSSGEDTAPVTGTEQNLGPVSVRFTGPLPVIDSEPLSNGAVAWATGTGFLEARATNLPDSLAERLEGSRGVGILLDVPRPFSIPPNAASALGLESASPFTTLFISADPKGRFVLAQDAVDGLVTYDVQSDTRKILGVASGRSPRWSPSGDRFAYIVGNGGTSSLRIRFRNNTGERTVPNVTGLTHFDWDSEGKLVVVSASGGGSLFRTIEIDGSNATTLTTTTLPCLSVSCSNVSGAALAILDEPAADNTGIMINYGIGASQVQPVTALANLNPLSVNRQIEPGTFLVTIEQEAVAGIQTSVMRVSTRRIATGLPTNSITQAVHLPAPTERRFVGDDGWPTKASGVFYGTSNLLGSSLTGFIAWEATPEASAAVEKMNVNSDGTVGLFHLKGDTITSLSYAASLTSPTATIVRKGTTGIGGAIATVNNLGGVTSLVTLGQQARGTSPKVRTEGGRIVIEGDIEGAFSEGANKAPKGASRIEIDPQTGSVVSAS